MFGMSYVVGPRRPNGWRVKGLSAWPTFSPIRSPKTLGTKYATPTDRKIPGGSQQVWREPRRYVGDTMHRGSVPSGPRTVRDRPRHYIIDRRMVELDLWIECRCGWVARASLAGAIAAYGEHLEGP
jgi:hypothetical protein